LNSKRMTEQRAIKKREKHRLHREAKRKEMRMHGFRQELQGWRNARRLRKHRSPSSLGFKPRGIIRTWMSIIDRRQRDEQKRKQRESVQPADNAVA